mmetsp:Transcript_16990/g.19444  ORF Transcript_16990/g.19444 Transcript_16990/m.19444 type:complete len:208 (+) Transcript_16990:155-778(+)
MDISQSSSFSRNSTGLLRVMVARTHDDSLHTEKYSKKREQYKLRLKERLEQANVTDSSHFKTTFTTIEIREYPIILGDNPSVSQGAPLTIGWEHWNVVKWDFDEYEETRPARRSYVEMSVPMEMRYNVLERSGYKSGEIMRKVKEIKALKLQRMETTQQLYRSESHEKLEKVQRRLRNFFNCGQKKKEREYLKRSEYLGQLPDTDSD